MNSPTKYRMYVDEVGNADLKATTLAQNKYLSLSGVIFSLDYARVELSPRLDDLKHRYFGSHPDHPVIFHRREMMRGEPPFHPLLNAETRKAFNKELLQLFETLEYTVITAVIDKPALVAKYQVWRADPYHYGVEVLLERYLRWLKERAAMGDVMAEARGKKEDALLKAVFHTLASGKGGYISADDCDGCLTSTQIKMREKRADVPGLQVADMLAQPSYQDFKARVMKETAPTGFGADVAAILNATKYRRSWNGRIDGYGRKWLP